MKKAILYLIILVGALVYLPGCSNTVSESEFVTERGGIGTFTSPVEPGETPEPGLTPASGVMGESDLSDAEKVLSDLETLTSGDGEVPPYTGGVIPNLTIDYDSSQGMTLQIESFNESVVGIVVSMMQDYNQAPTQVFSNVPEELGGVEPLLTSGGLHTVTIPKSDFQDVLGNGWNVMEVMLYVVDSSGQHVHTVTETFSAYFPTVSDDELLASGTITDQGILGDTLMQYYNVAREVYAFKANGWNVNVDVAADRIRQLYRLQVADMPLIQYLYTMQYFQLPVHGTQTPFASIDLIRAYDKIQSTGLLLNFYSDLRPASQQNLINTVLSSLVDGDFYPTSESEFNLGLYSQAIAHIVERAQGLVWAQFATTDQALFGHDAHQHPIYHPVVKAGAEVRHLDATHFESLFSESSEQAIDYLAEFLNSLDITNSGLATQHLNQAYVYYGQYASGDAERYAAYIKETVRAYTALQTH